MIYCKLSDSYILNEYDNENNLDINMFKGKCKDKYCIRYIVFVFIMFGCIVFQCFICIPQT